MGDAGRSLLERGVAAAERGRVAEGLALIREAVARDPADAQAHAQLGRWLSLLQQQPEAETVAERALALGPRDALTFDTLGVILSRGARHDRAVACFERAVALDPGNAGFQFNLASSLKFLGRFDAAEAAYEACIAADPRLWRAHPALAQLRRQTPAANHVSRLESLLDARDLDVDAELQLRHALAKELDDLGRYEAAFAHLVAGATRKRATLGYHFADDARLFDAVTRAFPRASEPDPAPVDGAPIFVVGLPRTGTTLVERILSSHPHVASAGESPNFPVLLKRAAGTRTGAVLDVPTLEQAQRVDHAAVGREYLRRTRPPGQKPRFVDKLPLNFFYLGHIARALPGVRMVVVRRDPLDTVIATFQQLFTTTLPYTRYAYDVSDIARYWLAFDALVAHWRRVLPGRVHEVRYESLVTDPQPIVAALLVHCGLPWDETCLAFDRHPDAVATASAVQVRQPIYASSVGRWRRHAAGLRPAIDVLRAAGMQILDVSNEAGSNSDAPGTAPW